MGQSMFANEAFACRIFTFGHANLADQERCKLTCNHTNTILNVIAEDSDRLGHTMCKKGKLLLEIS